VHMGPNGFVADGADIAIVDVEVIDKNGNRCPTALNQVNFALSGEAEWRGGIAQGPDNYVLSKILPVEGGINRVLIRSTTKSGSAILEAHSEGLKSATIQLNSRSFVSTNGLSPQFPSDGLPINLTRGPTPVAESFTMVRRPIAVTNISAGSNIQDAQKSVDDNETTNWTSDGKPDTAWIKFDFDKASQINQVVLKVVGWRTQSYPIRILVDEKAVFSGLTPRSLGYITLNIPPTLGKSVRIELTGNATNRDAFGNIVEIPGTPDTQSAAGKGGGKSTLGIVEAEFYTSSVK
jgi:beta-galactosidase